MGAEPTMANRVYLYSLGNRPTSYADRSEQISSLNEWPYQVPFSFRVLMSGDPQLCASLISDGLEGEPEAEKSRLYALSASFTPGLERLKKLCSAIHELTAGSAPELRAASDQMRALLEERRDEYLIMETVELDMMSAESEQALRASVERELAACRDAGAAVDALPRDSAAAAIVLAAAAMRSPTRRWWRPWAKSSPLDAFFGLVFSNDFDNTRDEKTHYPLGFSNWYGSSLYYELFNRAQFEAHMAGGGSG